MTESSDLTSLAARACELGAVEAKIVPASSVVTAPWTRLKCQFGCSGYGNSLCCPPHTPTWSQTREVVACYTRALLVHCHGEIRPTRVVVALERELFLAGYYKALAFGEGPCRLCKRCYGDKCAHPHEARPSMEACGMDVFATVRANGFPIQVLPDKSCEQNCYGLILID